VKWPSLFVVLLLVFFLQGCDPIQPRKGVGEVIGLKFGVPLELKIREGPREPPIFNGDLREFYEVEFPNMEFDFVGVAVTKNTDESRKEGFEFTREKIIWGAMFLEKGSCEEKDFLRTKEYLSKNWKITPSGEHRNKPGEPLFLQSTFVSPDAIWQITCGAGLGRTLIVRDYSVIKREGNDAVRKQIERMMSDVTETLKRKM